MARDFSAELFGSPTSGQGTDFSKELFGSKPKERTYGEAFTDVGAGVVSGIGSLVQLPGQLYGLATGDFEDTGLLGLGKSIRKSGEEMKSEALKQKEEQRAQKIAEAEQKGTFEAFKTAFGETVKDPALVTSFLAEQVPQLLVPFGAGKAGSAITAGKQLLAGATAKEAALAGGKAGVTTAIGAGGVQQGADIGAQSYEDIYKYLVKDGMSPDQAKSEALNLARASGAGAFVISLLAQRLPGAKTLEESFVGVPGVGGKVARIGKGIAGETGSEIFEESGGKIGQNIAMRQVNPEQALMEGVGATAGLAAVGGIGMGGLGGALQKAPQPTTKPPETKQTTDKLLNQSQLLLPAPDEQIINDKQYDPLRNPLGNFLEGELTPEQIAYINKDRSDNNKPRLNSYSLEDYVDALRHSSDTDVAKQGALDNILAFKTGYDGMVETTVDQVLNAALDKNIETGTQGFKDFLTRATGTDNLEVMSPVQLYSAYEALVSPNVPRSDTLQILPEGTNATRFTQKQYDQALNNLQAEYNFLDTDSLGRTSVINDIKDTTGLKDDTDAKALLRHAINRGDLEERISTAKVDGKDVNVVNIAFAGKTEALPSGFDIRYQTFKQGSVPENYEIKNGSVVLDRVSTEEEAKVALEKQTAIAEKKALDLEKDIEKIQSGVDRLEYALDEKKTLGHFGTPAYNRMATDIGAQIRQAKDRINNKLNDIRNLRNPFAIVPVGEKPVTAKKYVFYDNDTPLASFANKDLAEQYGLMRQNAKGEYAVTDETLQQIIDSAPTTKGTLPKRYASYATKELARRKGEAPQGIEVRKSMYQPKVEEDFEKIRQNLLPALKKFGLEKVGLRIVKSIADGKADGSYVQELIKIAYNAKNPMGTLRHEVIHALKELGAFTQQEWKILENKAKSEWIDKYIKKVGTYKAYQDAYKQSNGDLKGFDEYIAEEAIAEAFRDFANTKPPVGLIGNLFFRLNKMFEALGNTFKRLGYATAGDIFQKVERGEAKPTKTGVAGKEKFQIKPEDVLKIEAGLDGYLTEQEENLRQNYIYNNRGRNELGKALESNDAYQDALQQNLNAIDIPNTVTMYRGRDVRKNLNDSQGGYLNVSSNKKLAENFRKASMTDPKNWVVDKFLVPKNAIIGLGHVEESEFLVNMNKGVEIVGITTEPKTIENVVIPKLEGKEEIRKIGKRIVGSPPNATTEQARTALVKRMVNILEHPYAMFGKSKNWYERSGATIREISRGDKELMEKVVRLTSIYSQANSLGGNITAVVKSLKQIAEGYPSPIAGRFPATTSKNLPAILSAKEFNTDLQGVEDKLMNFYRNLHDAAFQEDTFNDASTIDRWMMRLFGYPHIDDEQEGGSNAVSTTQYKYAKDLIVRITNAYNKKTGENLLPRQVQAGLWTYVKNQTEFSKAEAKAKEKGKPVKFEPMATDFADYLNRATVNITWESRPSTKLPLLEGIHNAPRQAQEAFNRAVRKIFETDSGENKIFQLLNNAVLYNSQESIGAYEDKIVPNVVTRVVLSQDDIKANLAGFTNMADQVSAIIGYVTKQDAVAWYRPDPTAKGKSASKGFKVTPNQELTVDLENKIFEHLNTVMPGIGFTRVNNSLDFINFRGDDGKPFLMPDKDYDKKLVNALETFSSDVNFNVDEFRAVSGYIYNDWEKDANGQGYLERFSSRELANIRTTINGWSKAYDTLAEEYGTEYGWSRPPEPSVRPSSTSGEGVTLGRKQEYALSYEAVHYSNAERQFLDGDKYGTGIRGAEASRLQSVDDPLIKNRTYFYIPHDELGGRYLPPEGGLGKFKHTQKFDNILGPGIEMRRILDDTYYKTRDDAGYNRFETAVIDSGYDGYALPNMGMMVILNHNNIPVNPENKEGGRYQIRAPETKEFKQWFGDSKIVNEDGSPKVMYHGTSFDIAHFKSGQGNAIFFTDNLKVAENYAKDAEIKSPLGVYPNIMPVFISAKNPFDYSNSEHREQIEPYVPYDQYAKADEMKKVSYGDWNAIESDQIQEGIKKAGFDGFYVKENGVKNLAVYKPSQVKSATGNRGTFDETNPDIRYQIRAPETKEFKQFFKDSEVVDNNGNPLVMYHGTYDDFTVPKINFGDNEYYQFGFHVGNSEQASKRIADLNNPGNFSRIRNKEPSVMPFYVQAKNPLRLDENRTGRWGVDDIMKAVIEKAESQGIDGITQEMINDYYNDQFDIEEITGATEVGSVDYDPDKKERFWADDYDWKSGEKSSYLKTFLEQLGYDSIVYANEYEGGGDSYILLSPNQVKSVFNQKPTKSKDIRYQIRNIMDEVDPDINSRVGATTRVREEKGFVERLIDAISPTSFAKYRQAFVNKYEAIELLSRQVAREHGSDRLLANTSAIAAALQSDRAAGVAAASFKQGIPVYRNGFFTVDPDTKGLIPILEPLMAYNDPYIFQLFQYYGATRRGKRLDAEGRERTFTKEDIAYGDKLEKQFPEFKQVFNEYQTYNKGLVDLMVDRGVITKEEGRIWTQNWDYIPFYRQMDGETTAGPKVFSSFTAVAKPKELKGAGYYSVLDANGQEIGKYLDPIIAQKKADEANGTVEQVGAPITDFLETVVRNARAAIEASMKNEAGNRIIRDTLEMGLAQEVPLGTNDSAREIVTIKQDGKNKYFRVADPLLYEALKGLNTPQMQWLSWLAAPANLLRNFVTKDPGFMIANLGRDSLQAWITSGTDMRPVIDTFKQFSKTLTNSSPEAQALALAGLTGYDFSGDVKGTSKGVAKELRKMAGQKTKLESLTTFWDMLEQGSHASDMATRAEIYKRTLERTKSPEFPNGNEAEAFYQAMEVLNFSRKGNSAIIQIVSAVVPFFNARVQGLDVLYRSGWGRMATENADVQKKAFANRALIMMGLSMAYWFMMTDSDEYKKLSKEERDNYWIIPALSINDKPFRFPIPFELGVVFKVLPERVLETMFGNDTGKDLRESIFRNMTNTLQFNPIPQAFIPIVENVTNHSFFTGENIVGRGMEDLAPQFQYTQSTSQFAKDIGATLGSSPIKIENLIRGYTGTMGTYALQMLDAVYRTQGDDVRASMRLEQMPVIKRFFSGDSGTISAYYDLKQEVNTVVRTLNLLEKSGDIDAYMDYMKENGSLYNMRGYINSIDKNMKQVREARKYINDAKGLSPDEKREQLDSLHDIEISLTENIKQLRKEYR